MEKNNLIDAVIGGESIYSYNYGLINTLVISDK